MKNIVLRNGIEMPLVNFGVYQIPQEQTKQAALDVISVGYEGCSASVEESLFFNHQNPDMVEWFSNMVVTSRQQQDASKEKKRKAGEHYEKNYFSVFNHNNYFCIFGLLGGR